MLCEEESGAILQRDRSYAIVPHLPCGLVTPSRLRQIADVAERFSATLKCTSAQRIAIIGLKEEDVDRAWEALGGRDPGWATGSVVRSVRACPGTQFCKRARQDSLEMGLELDRRYHGKPMPNKVKIGVSGCNNQCAESSIKDVGLIGGPKGWLIVVGGSAGNWPRLAKPLNEQEVSTERALELVEAVLTFYKAQARPSERLGDCLCRVGLHQLKAAVGVN